MKKLLLTLAIIPTLFLSGCSTLNSWAQTTQGKYFAQAFANLLRSLEGAGYGPDKIPSLIMAARDKWLPAGHEWDVFAADLIHKYVVASPNNPAEVNRILEQLATELQK